MSTGAYHAAATDAATKRLLYEVSVHGPCNVRTLADKTNRNYTALQKALQKLHAKGLLQRRGKENNVIWSVPMQRKEQSNAIRAATRDGLPVCRSVWDLALYA